MVGLQAIWWVVSAPPPLIGSVARAFRLQEQPKIEKSYCYAIARRSLAENVAPFGRARPHAARGRGRVAPSLLPPLACGLAAPRCRAILCGFAAALVGGFGLGARKLPPADAAPQGAQGNEGERKSRPQRKKARIAALPSYICSIFGTIFDLFRQ